MKRDSVDGRILIWKVTTSLIKDKPIFGQGYGQFQAHYMNYQADYFRQNPGIDEASIAGNSVYPFNEFLRITTETGIIGLIISLVVLYSSIFGKCLQRISDFEIVWIRAARTGIIAIIVFACFSYPDKIIPIKINFVLFLATISKHQKPTIYINKLIFGNNLIRILVIIVIMMLYFPIKHLSTLYSANKKWKSANNLYNMAAYDACLINYQSAYPHLRFNGEFLVNYGKALSMAGKHEKAIEVLKESQEYLNNTILYTAMGDSYKVLAEYQFAEQAYWQAWYMIPSRFYPKYLLAIFYNDTGQHQKAVAIAKELLHKEVKIESKAIDEIREEMRTLISTYESFEK